MLKWLCTSSVSVGLFTPIILCNFLSLFSMNRFDSAYIALLRHRSSASFRCGSILHQFPGMFVDSSWTFATGQVRAPPTVQRKRTSSVRFCPIGQMTVSNGLTQMDILLADCPFSTKPGPNLVHFWGEPDTVRCPFCPLSRPAWPI